MKLINEAIESAAYLIEGKATTSLFPECVGCRFSAMRELQTRITENVMSQEYALQFRATLICLRNRCPFDYKNQNEERHILSQGTFTLNASVNIGKEALLDSVSAKFIRDFARPSGEAKRLFDEAFEYSLGHSVLGLHRESDARWLPDPITPTMLITDEASSFDW